MSRSLELDWCEYHKLRTFRYWPPGQHPDVRASRTPSGLIVLEFFFECMKDGDAPKKVFFQKHASIQPQQVERFIGRFAYYAFIGSVFSISFKPKKF